MRVHTGWKFELLRRCRFTNCVVVHCSTCVPMQLHVLGWVVIWERRLERRHGNRMPCRALNMLLVHSHHSNWMHKHSRFHVNVAHALEFVYNVHTYRHKKIDNIPSASAGRHCLPAFHLPLYSSHHKHMECVSYSPDSGICSITLSYIYIYYIL